jgi:peptidoglycan/LPS O-acetylase OafA/YrhL
MSTPTTSQRSRMPKRVYLFVVLLFGLIALDLFGIVNTLDSESPIIRKLTPLRVACLGLGALCFSAAAILLLRRSAIGRWLVIAGLAGHYAYMIYYNVLVLTKDGTPTAIEITGMTFGMVFFLCLLSTIAAVPFTSKFSAFLKTKPRQA